MRSPTRPVRTIRASPFDRSPHPVRLATALSVALLFVPALSAEAQHFKGRCEGSVLAGSPGWPHLKAKMRAVRASVKAADLDAAIAAQREVVVLQCHNHFQRYHLAALLVRRGDHQAALDELVSLDDLGVNDLETRLLNPDNELHPLVRSGVYAGSELERRLEAQRVSREARRRRFARRLEGLSAEARPPKLYVAKDVCPFECCSFGDWKVTDDTPLHSSPGHPDTIAWARSGSEVVGVTGEVHLVPRPVAVVHELEAREPATTVHPGEIVFLLDSLGEGYRRIWHAGEVRTVEAAGGAHMACPHPDRDCWGEPIDSPADGSEPVWWVRVRLEDGREGWTSQTDHFDGIGGCG